MTRLTLSLWENAISFLVEALTRAVAADKDSCHWKFAIFSLIQAIELTIKERLRREHSLLVFADIDNPRTTVSLEKALARLGKIQTVSLTGDDIRNIQLAASIRNTLTHHEVDVSVDQVRVVFAKLFGFITEFSRQQLQVEVSTKIPEDIWRGALKVDRNTVELYRRAEQQIADEGIDKKYLLTCIKCWHDTYVDRKPIQRCYLCGFDDETTVCQECGCGMFKSEGHTAYYGKWYIGNSKVLEDWYPDLCDICYEDFLAKTE